MHKLPVTLCAFLACLTVLARAEALPDAPSSVQNVRSLAALAPERVMTTVQPSALPELAIATRPDRTAKVIDRDFLVLGALTFGLTVADVELTQHCLHEKTCVELNPTLPHSRLGMYAANTPVNLAVMYFSYRRKASGKRGWWIAPLVDVGAHALGVGSNLRFVW